MGGEVAVTGQGPMRGQFGAQDVGQNQGIAGVALGRLTK